MFNIDRSKMDDYTRITDSKSKKRTEKSGGTKKSSKKIEK